MLIMAKDSAVAHLAMYIEMKTDTAMDTETDCGMVLVGIGDTNLCLIHCVASGQKTPHHPSFAREVRQ